MGTKKTKKSYKTPEKSISAKVNYYKGETRLLRRRIDNLEKRMADLETRSMKQKTTILEDIIIDECINTDDEKSLSEFKKDFLKKNHPKFRSEENE